MHESALFFAVFHQLYMVVPAGKYVGPRTKWHHGRALLALRGKETRNGLKLARRLCPPLRGRGFLGSDRDDTIVGFIVMPRGSV